ncbi:XisI protein [Rudanella lutea]|uniref:XisI protein n=1 Tax=Rudanella lutea TaxID=451374 RepID=UPI00048881D6|nr:XisI protein [Rudanella lutea]
MDKLDRYRQLIQQLLIEQTSVPYAYGEITIETIFDTANDRYMLADVGWDRTGRVYGIIAHIDIIGGKFWIQRDGTEESIPVMLLNKGVPREDIVVAYRTPAERELMGFAVA